MPLRETLCRRKPFVFTCLLILASVGYLAFHVSGWTSLQQTNRFHMQIASSLNRTEGSSQPKTSQQDPGLVSAGSLANSTSCSSLPRNLSGQVLVSSEPITPEQLVTKYPYIEMGGRLKPHACLSDQKVAIIIPYRNRSQHLHILLNNLIPILHRQLIDAVIFVVEQAPPTTFNRGFLLNIGFLESQKVGKFDCVILHDVDMIPTHDSCLYRCEDNPKHFISSINSNRLPYEFYFGGVVGMKSDLYRRINGHSNLYFGWGGEDDDLLIRCQNKGYRHLRNPQIIGNYYTFKHQRDKGNEENADKFGLYRTARRRQDIEGLNTATYRLEKLEQRPLYTWISVSVDMKQTLQAAPDYMKADITNMLKSVQ
ncbi:hypothetical protein BsWGS_17043 [Bradybaena similaris]